MSSPALPPCFPLPSGYHFFFIFRASEEMNDSPSCSLWLFPAKKAGGSTIHLGAEQPALEQAECPCEKYIPPLRQCLGPCILTTEISPNRCADFCDLTVCTENSFSEHLTPPLDVGLLFCTTDCSLWIFCTIFGAKVGQLLSCTLYPRSHGCAETFNGLLIALITSQDRRGIVG